MMPLPNARVGSGIDILTEDDIYPDSVWITLKYNIAPLASLATFARMLRAEGFAQPSSRRLLGKNFTDPLCSRPIYVTASFNVRARTASFTAQFSPLADLRDNSLDYSDENSRPYRARTGRSRIAENWLHPDQVDAGTRYRVINHVWEKLTVLEPQINEVASRLVTEGPFTGYAALVAMKLAAVELCTDLATTCSHYCLRRFVPRFRERFNRIVAVKYGGTAHAYAELTHDANLIRGYRALGQSMKAYEKTSRRLRLEFSAIGSGLRTLTAATANERQRIAELTGYPCPNDAREFRGERQFTLLFRRLVERVLPEFNVIRGSSPEPGDHRSIFELMSQTATTLRRHTPAEMERAYRALTLEGRLTSRTLALPALLRLERAGVLRRSTPGIYIPTDRFRRALRAVRVGDGRWRGLMQGAAE